MAAGGDAPASRQRQVTVDAREIGRQIVGRARALGARPAAWARSQAAEPAVGSHPEPLDGPVDNLPGAGERAFWIGLVVVVLSLISALATYLILTGLTPIAPRNDVVLTVLLINILLILAMFAVIGTQAYGLVRAWRNKMAGARIHVRIVALFTVIAALPAILLAVAATVSFSRSIDNWFSSRTRTIVANSLDVARAYLEEHGQVIRSDVVNMAKDVDDLAGRNGITQPSSSELGNLVMAQTGLRDLSLAAIIDNQGRIIRQSAGDTRVRYAPPPAALIAQADAGQAPLIGPSEGNTRVAALARLERFPGTYLYAARNVNPRVVGHMLRTEDAVAEYQRLRDTRGGLKLVHGVMYFMIAMTGVLAAIWVGLWFARHLVAPIRRLIGAAQRVARGDLTVKLPLLRGEGDLRRLSRDFNYMTQQIAEQRNELVTTNAQLIERRRFMEAVLSGVSAGVIGLDAEGRIRLANPSAERLLGITAGDLVGQKLTEAVPGLAEAIADDTAPDLKSRAQTQVTLSVSGEERSFAVRVTREQAGSGAQGSVVTFDDITELVSAQRASAWGDVARRIAHEIKNPLTPIQLSAERIRRKYGASISNDRETFEKLTDTIVRQVGDIKKMVDEFASFARVPKPQMEAADIREALQEPFILFREAHPGVAYDISMPQAAVIVSCDQRLMTQAITNLVKNATESVESASEAPDREADWRPRVEARLKCEADRVVIEIIDNGLGLPKQQRARLLEPYVTTKGHKGTGLGLAIVQKIIEQHGGTLFLEDAPIEAGEETARGAQVRIHLPIRLQAGAQSPTAASPVQPAA
jgi:two-component system nitrogen regulation sensor histidine kinase NtrY